MGALFQVEADVLEETDNWNVGAIAVPKTGQTGPILLTQADIAGAIELDVFTPGSSTPVYSTSFAKTLVQSGSTYAAVHAATVDSLWPSVDLIGHNFAHKIRAVDLLPATLDGSRRYTFKYRIPTVDDGIVVAIWVWNIKPVHA